MSPNFGLQRYSAARALQYKCSQGIYSAASLITGQVAEAKRGIDCPVGNYPPARRDNTRWTQNRPVGQTRQNLQPLLHPLWLFMCGIISPTPSNHHDANTGSPQSGSRLGNGMLCHRLSRDVPQLSEELQRMACRLTGKIGWGCLGEESLI